MKPDQIRTLFLEFFRERGHRIVDSVPVVPHGDPTLLFTNAGMNQFKDVFLGTGTRDYSRAADTQKCIRVSGKHNDLEVVGRDGYHHTFFEMLGNWSFGDYFKKEAIAWGWDFMVNSCGLPPERLYATVFGGDGALGVGADEEAEGIWVSETGIGSGHVFRFGKEDNFWEMGATGPCGPCSEIHMDLGPSACDNPRHAKDGSDCRVNGDCGRFLEVWNLVFIQYNRLESGVLEKLPARHVDTGMGFERLCEIIRVRQDLAKGGDFSFSNYNTELFTPIFEVLREVTGLAYSPRMEARRLVAYRVIADHIRALCVAIADNVMPDKKKRGSVLRSLLRRAARFGRQSLDIQEPFMYRLVEPVADTYAQIFPEVSMRANHIRLVIEAEEKSFSRTVERGLGRFRALVDKTRAGDPDAKVMDGFEAFRLFHQDGFPKDLIQQMAAEEGLEIREDAWVRAEEEHRKASESDALAFQFDLEEIKGLPPTDSIRGTAATDLKILKIIDNDKIVLDKTPFYAESGGQVGDRGVIEGGMDDAAPFRFVVHDTGKIGDMVIHYGEIEKGDLDYKPRVTARVDESRRLDTAANHTATHLLHWALRQVLGQHATQQGSLVRPDYFRFDFTHPRQVTAEELQEIERLVNQRIQEDHEVVIEDSINIEEAKRMGAMALFGEKYDEYVRMISIGDFSRELCGGTHLQRTGQAGYFRIQTESAVQSGVRRITALTRQRAVDESLHERSILQGLARRLSSPADALEAKIEGLMSQVRDLRKEASAAGKASGDRGRIAAGLLEKALEAEGVRVLVHAEALDLDKDQVGELADFLRQSHAPLVGALAGLSAGNVSVTIFASQELVKQRGISCGKALKAAAGTVGRKGGGRHDFAQTGWKESDGVDLARFMNVVLEEFRRMLRK